MSMGAGGDHVGWLLPPTLQGPSTGRGMDPTSTQVSNMDIDSGLNMSADVQAKGPLLLVLPCHLQPTYTEAVSLDHKHAVFVKSPR
jgi:hypothetical protein